MKLSNFTILLCFILSALSMSLSAQVFVNGAATGSNDGTSWDNAFTDLTNAIMSTPVGGEVWVAAGIYYPGGDSPSRDTSFTMPHDMRLYGGFAGTETDLSERDFEQNITQLSGDHMGDDIDDNFTTNRMDNSRHVMFISNAISPESVIDGFLIANGSSDDVTSAGDLRRGGGILSYGSPSVSNCTFTQNFGWFAGGLYPRFDSTGRTMIITDCSFINNSAGAGGGIFCNKFSCELRNCVFTQNTSENSGAGLYIQNREPSIIDNCTFELNLTANGSGGGIANFDTELTLTNSTFISNRTATGRGGGIFHRGASLNSVISSCVFQDNNAGNSSGAGIYLAFTDIENFTSISDCELTGGVATWGGGLTAFGPVTSTEVLNCDFNNNLSVNIGGAVYAGFGGNITVSNSTINQNESGNGGAVGTQNDSTFVRLIDSDISRNVATRGGAIHTLSGQGDTLFALNPKIEIERCSFNFNECGEQGGVLNLQDADADISSSLFTNNVNASAEGAGGVISFNTSGPVINVYNVTNNTFFGNTGPLGAVIGNWTDSTGVSSLVLQNNIFSGSSSDSYAIEAGTPEVVSNGGNLSDDSSLMLFANAMNDTHNEDPMLSAPGFGEFNLSQESPAIDMGIAAGAPELDLLGAERVFGVDKGALEFTETVAVEDLQTSLKQLSVYPNPSVERLQYTLDNNWSGPVQLTVKNVMGQIIHKEVIQKNETELAGSLTISAYQNGSFLLNLRNDTHSVTRTFIKQ